MPAKMTAIKGPKCIDIRLVCEKNSLMSQAVLSIKPVAHIDPAWINNINTLISFRRDRYCARKIYSFNESRMGKFLENGTD